MPTLLIIDDNESVRESLSHVFSRRGFTVSLAEGGAAGLAVYGRGGIDAALIDINMPGMDGIEVCRLLQEQARKAGHKIPTWLMTGAIGGYGLEAAMSAGAEAVLHKPFDIGSFTRDLESKLAELGEGRIA